MKTIVVIDGGHLRVLARQAGLIYDADLIEAIGCGCVDRSETLIRVQYYDCVPFNGVVRLPVTGAEREFAGSDRWLSDLAERDFMMTRLGTLKFRGFKPRSLPITPGLGDDDFRPDFEQRGLDLRIGLDVADIVSRGAAERMVWITGDPGLAPAFEHARHRGVQIIVVSFPGQRVPAELLWASDVNRQMDWPAS
ncbi:NYN domain-containing protein [Alsobacter soli]|nr:NYN domain-containing protein [Alsobacter soli]